MSAQLRPPDVFRPLCDLLEELLEAGRMREARAVAYCVAWNALAWTSPGPSFIVELDPDHLELLIEDAVAAAMGEAAHPGTVPATGSASLSVATLLARALEET